ncbi:hypothetical protein ACV229_31365 [Burkholderia sp. MR1-5-21]
MRNIDAADPFAQHRIEAALAATMALELPSTDAAALRLKVPAAASPKIQTTAAGIGGFDTCHHGNGPGPPRAWTMKPAGERGLPT